MDRQFNAYLLMVFLLGFSSGIILIATPLFLVELAVSQVDFGLVIGATSIGALIIKIPLGLLSDKLGKKRMLYAGCFLMMISITLFPMFPRWLLFFRIAQGFSMSMIMVPLAALFVEMFRESGRVAWFNSSLSLGVAVIGPLFGGILPQIVGFTYTFLFSAVLLLFSVRVLPHIDEPKTYHSTTVIEKERNVPSLVNASILGAANTAAFVIFSSFMPLFAAKVLNLSPSLIGFIVFLEGITFVLLAIPIGKMADGYGRFKVLLLGSIITLFEFFIFYISTNFVDLVLASILVGISAGFVVPTSFSLAADSMPEKGKAMGIYQTSNNIGALIGPAFAGILSTAFGIKYAFLSIVPIILVCWAMIVIIYYRSKIPYH